jgi:hypothetical protein
LTLWVSEERRTGGGGVGDEGGDRGRWDVDADGWPRVVVGVREGDRACDDGLRGRAVVGDTGGVVRGRWVALAAALLDAVWARCPLRGDDGGGSGDDDNKSGERAPPRVLRVGVSDLCSESSEIRSLDGPGWSGGGRLLPALCSASESWLVVGERVSFLGMSGTGPLMSLVEIMSCWAFIFLARGGGGEGDTRAATLEDDAAAGSANDEYCGEWNGCDER